MPDTGRLEPTVRYTPQKLGQWTLTDRPKLSDKQRHAATIHVVSYTYVTLNTVREPHFLSA